MKYPKAYSGIKKVFASEILNIISTVIVFLTSVFSVYVRDDVTFENDPAGFFALLGLTGGSVLFALIAFILQLVGFNQARKEERLFKKCIYFVIICAVCTVAMMFTGGMFNKICAGIDEVSTLLVNVYLIMGIYTLAENLENPSMQKRGKVVLLIVTILFGSALALQIVMAFMPEFAENLNVVNAIIEFVGYIICLVYVGMGVRMLSKLKHGR
ncbi:MAG: hypothetical protein IJ598_02895 [Ruminococcus sp.]|nr:hypothetical protein [Ruminococcus sp.]